MQPNSVATVSERERDLILTLHERRTAMKELFLTLNSNFLTEEERNKLRDMLIDEFAQTNAQYERWWHEIQAKYDIPLRDNTDLNIDFESREICYVDQACRKERFDLELA